MKTTDYYPKGKIRLHDNNTNCSIARKKERQRILKIIDEECSGKCNALHHRDCQCILVGKIIKFRIVDELKSEIEGK